MLCLLSVLILVWAYLVGPVGLSGLDRYRSQILDHPEGVI